MKRCPECRRDYYDDSLLYCLDDGTALLDGPASLPMPNEPRTAILRDTNSAGEAATRAQVHTTQATSEASAPAFRGKLLIIAGAAVLILGAGFLGYRYVTARAQINSIAVMPFINESGNSDNEYLSDGMTESLIGNLSKVPNLNVKARSSVFRYKGKDIDAKTVGKELGVQAVLNGRVVQRGEQLILGLELIDTSTENVLWSEQYTRKQTDLVSLQSEIARDVSGKLRAKLSGAERNQVTNNYTTDADAYKLYLQGRYYWNKRTVADLKRSIEYFQQAIDRDPTFALAYASLANSYEILPDYDASIQHTDVFQKARAAANRALEIDASLAEAHNALAYVNFHEWKFADAEKEFKAAIQLNPNYATTHHWYSELLEALRRVDEAIAEAKKAQELDPLSLIIGVQVAETYISARQYDQAIEQSQKVIEMDQNFARVHNVLGFIYEQKGMFDEAMAEYEKAEILGGLRSPEQLRKEYVERRAAYKSAGWKGVWQKDIEIAIRDKPPYATPEFIAERYALIGEKDKAFEYLEKAYQERDPILIYLKLRPSWDALRDDARFVDLVRRVGFPEQ